MATPSCSTDALTWPFITTGNPAWSFLSTPPRVVSSPPGLPTQTGTSRCSRSSTARSRDGATTLTRSRSSKRSGGRLAPDLATRMEEALSSASPDLHVPMRLGGVAWRVGAADVDLAAVVPHPADRLHDCVTGRLEAIEHESYGHGALADGGRHPLDRPAADIADTEDSGPARLEQRRHLLHALEP